ncbi:ATP-dependent DNA helicase RecG [Marinospirillum sp.]|uniref:ATP-dependent DNA helicase RecG n=1 Tax=Marinospirillum sp. TaxID=2183934 RepID=UPI003A88E4BF
MHTPPLDQQPVTQLKGVGQALAAKLQRLGLTSVQDLLFHLPLRYEDRTQLTPLGQLRPGQAAVIQGQVIHSQVQQGKRRSLLVRLSDSTGIISLRFFHFTAAMQAQLPVGAEVQAYGEARPGTTGLELYHPEFRQLHANQTKGLLETSLTPIYPLTEGVTQARLRQLIQQALALLDISPLAELLPRAQPLPPDWPDLHGALVLLHQPPRDALWPQLENGQHPALRRLAFEELLAHQVSMLLLRQKIRQDPAAALSLPRHHAHWPQALRDALPFQLTGAQERVLQEIQADLRQTHPMLRLVQGDVGSGKTLVAALACLEAIGAGYQAALMAPTELLAEQHERNLSAWLTPLGIRVRCLTGKMKTKARQECLAALESGDTQLLIGTHALFQNQVRFHRLALVVIDEQHRFGVHQRLALRDKGQLGAQRPHQLIMTATPIPRTLAMSAYADLDVSVIDELPPGRQPIQTLVVPDTRRHEVIERVRHACSEGRQAYWVCTLIEESEVLDCQAAEATWQALVQDLPELHIGLVHGRMKAAEKAEVMAAFQAGHTQLLVATTVIEVGVDVPNASLMIIDNAERLGLAQLHQLRGRVGRGQIDSYCLLVYHPPLTAHGRERLAVMRASHDGFVIAQKDLELRGPGELLGTRQTGELTFKIAQLQRDADLFEQLKPFAQQLLEQEPHLAQALISRWQTQELDYAQA